MRKGIIYFDKNKNLWFISKWGVAFNSKIKATKYKKLKLEQIKLEQRMHKINSMLYNLTV